MKALCIVSHTVPLGSGRFIAYDAGQIYEIDNPEGACWERFPADPAPVPARKKSGKSRINDDKEEINHEHD